MLEGKLTIREAINISSSPEADLSWSGITTTAMAGENLVIGDVCYMQSDGKYWKADATQNTTMPGVVIATGTIYADNLGIFLLAGYVRNDGWSWAVGGSSGMFYINTTPGVPTQTAPSASGNQVQAVGCATAGNIIYFNPSLVIVELA